MKKILCIVALIVALIGCTEKKNIEEKPVCSCPHCVICIQPYDNYTKQEVNKILPDLEKNFEKWLYGEWKFEVMDPKPLPPNAYVKSPKGERYSANVILNSDAKLKKGFISDTVFIGLTHKDICTDIHGMKDYGIMGLSYRPGNFCIVSDYRIKTKSMVWKIMLHEFMHSYFGAVHCPNDDPECFMKDAKGKGNIEVQKKLCGSCIFLQQ